MVFSLTAGRPAPQQALQATISLWSISQASDGLATDPLPRMVLGQIVDGRHLDVKLRGLRGLMAEHLIEASRDWPVFMAPSDIIRPHLSGHGPGSPLRPTSDKPDYVIRGKVLARPANAVLISSALPAPKAGQGGGA